MSYTEAIKKAEEKAPYFSSDFYYHCPTCHGKINLQDKFCKCGQYLKWDINKRCEE